MLILQQQEILLSRNYEALCILSGLQMKGIDL